MTTADNQRLDIDSSQALAVHRAISGHREADSPLALNPNALETIPDPRELTNAEAEWPSLARLHDQLKDAVHERDVCKIAELQRGLVHSTAVVRSQAEAEAQLKTASYQNVFDHMVPDGMLLILQNQLAPDSQTELFRDHAELVTKQRSSQKTRVYRQRKILAMFKESGETSGSEDNDFFEFAMAYGFFENGERFWAALYKLTQLHKRWSVVLPLLRAHFFHTHCDENDWEAVARGPVNRYFTPTDIEKVCKRTVDPGQADPSQSDILRQYFSLEFDRFGVVDPVRCWKAVHDTITSDLRWWREARPGVAAPHFSERLRITASEQIESTKDTAQRGVGIRLEAHADGSMNDNSVAQNHSALARTENVPARRSARTTVPSVNHATQTAASMSTLSAPNVHRATATPQKRSRGSKKTGSIRKKAKQTRTAADDREEVQASDDDDDDVDDDKLQEEERRLDVNSRASNIQSGLEYMSEPEREDYRASCHVAAALFEKAAQFIEPWIEQVRNSQERHQAFEQLEGELASFEQVNALVSEDGHKLATEWTVSGHLTREAFDQALVARTSADVWCLTNAQAYELMELGVRIENPVVVRSNEHFCSLSDFLCMLEHRYTLNGELAVQDRTGADSVKNMKIGEVLQRLQLKPDPTDPLCFKPLNCLDITAFRPYTSVPAAMQHRRFTIVEAMQRFQSQNAKSIVYPGKQNITRAQPGKNSTRPADMESCAAFMLLASELAFSTWHEDLLNNTWLQCLTGKKAWFMRVNDDEGLPAVVILEPGDWLLMPAGLRVKHAVLTLEGPSLMTGGQHLDGHCLIPQLNEINELIDNPDRTNESVPALQLPIMLDTIIDYISKHPEDHRLFSLGGFPGNLPRLREG
ncbi:hypothetical protein KCV07_g9906, partial [Aureobasidium melanogenum]